MKHPAKFTDRILDVIEDVLIDVMGDGWRVLDPFAGVGKVHRLPCVTVGVEIEPEWGTLIPETADPETSFPVVGNALALPFRDATFDAVVTSPTYGNRFADSHQAEDSSRRRSYTHDLRDGTGDPTRRLHHQNSGGLQWGDQYRRFHLRAWREATRVIRPGGYLILNMKNHVRGGRVRPVCTWHRTSLEAMGWEMVRGIRVPVTGMGYGENRDARVDHEVVYLFQRGEDVYLTPGEMFPSL